MEAGADIHRNRLTGDVSGAAADREVLVTDPLFAPDRTRTAAGAWKGADGRYSRRDSQFGGSARASVRRVPLPRNVAARLSKDDAALGGDHHCVDGVHRGAW